MLSGVVSKILRIFDFRDVIPDELVGLSQGLGVPDDLPLFRSGCFRPGYLQDQVMCFDDVAIGCSIGIASLIIDMPCLGHRRVDGVAGITSGRVGTTGIIVVLDAANILVDFSLDSLRTL
jgi:hypothetical protein